MWPPRVPVSRPRRDQRTCPLPARVSGALPHLPTDCRTDREHAIDFTCRITCLLVFNQCTPHSFSHLLSVLHFIREQALLPRRVPSRVPVWRSAWLRARSQVWGSRLLFRGLQRLRCHFPSDFLASDLRVFLKPEPLCIFRPPLFFTKTTRVFDCFILYIHLATIGKRATLLLPRYCCCHCCCTLPALCTAAFAPSPSRVFLPH